MATAAAHVSCDGTKTTGTCTVCLPSAVRFSSQGTGASFGPVSRRPPNAKTQIDPCQSESQGRELSGVEIDLGPVTLGAMESSPGAPKPTAKDIAATYRREITNGERAPGSRLPAARQLAKDLGVQLMTVQNAFGQLRDEGLVLTQQGRGTFVRDPSLPLGTEPGSSPAFAALAEELSSIHDALRLLGERLDRLERVVDDGSPASR